MHGYKGYFMIQHSYIAFVVLSARSRFGYLIRFNIQQIRPRLTFIDIKQKSFAIFPWILVTHAHKNVIKNNNNNNNKNKNNNIILDLLLPGIGYLEDVLLVEST